MNRTLALVAAVGLAVLGGCSGNPCEDASDRIIAKFESCGIDTTSSEEYAEENDADCSEAQGQQAQCVADCVDAAGCGAFDGSDLDGATSYASCVTNC